MMLFLTIVLYHYASVSDGITAIKASREHFLAKTDNKLAIPC